MLKRSTTTPVRLHLGSGGVRLPGWLNVDKLALPGVDVVHDVRRGLPFDDVEAVYAEHFLEHVELGAALDLLLEIRRVLRPDGWLRLSTPNLDWVWATHYRLDAALEPQLAGALALNRAFHAWGHRFLWNPGMLRVALIACGFSEPRFCRYGESELELLRGLERHEPSPDAPDLPHVVIAEAQPGPARTRELADLRARVQAELLAHMIA